ncbi:hypothetical protein QCA50_007743 [Cerrena zonata]|uniref:Uncharacterized protein n=1 Tax=Cerrena zonata TaxID=2478898 RepID=A0AAW0GGF2_9APHY
MSLLCRRYVVPCKGPNEETIRLCIARYSLFRDPPSSGTILFCSHGHGGYKEQWMPLLEHLLSPRDLDITEAWCIDWYLYGDSLAYNKDFVMATPDTGIESLSSIYSSTQSSKRSQSTLMRTNPC